MRNVKQIFGLKGMLAAASLVAGVTGLAISLAADSRPELALPIDCKLGKTCFIQHYFDADAGIEGRDYMCGRTTYHGHNGVDFRLLSTGDVERGVAVLAAAPGIVAGRWRGMMDNLFDPRTHRGFRGRECGNGVVVDHGDRWKTTYCHLKFRSIKVWAGKEVERGEILGYVGYTGAAQFPHLHFSVRYKEERLDPFTGLFPAEGCPKPEAVKQGMWQAGTFDGYSYRTGRILEAAFVAERVEDPRKETGLAVLPRPDANSPVLVFATRTMNLEKGDRLRLTVEGPGGLRLEELSEPEQHSRAAHGTALAQERREKKPWAKGIYTGRVAILRNGKVIDELSQTHEIK